MQTIYEKLARCSSAGEVERMLRGNGYELVREGGDMAAPQIPRVALLNGVVVMTKEMLETFRVECWRAGVCRGKYEANNPEPGADRGPAKPSAPISA